MREKADEKTHAEMSKAGDIVAQLLKIIEALKKGDTPDVEKVKEILEDDVKNPEPLDMEDM